MSTSNRLSVSLQYFNWRFVHTSPLARKHLVETISCLGEKLVTDRCNGSQSIHEYGLMAHDQDVLQQAVLQP